MLHFEECRLDWRDVRDLGVDDFGAPQDCGEVLLGREICLLDPDLLCAIACGLGGRSRITEQIDRAVTLLLRRWYGSESVMTYLCS